MSDVTTMATMPKSIASPGNSCTSMRSGRDDLQVHRRRLFAVQRDLVDTVIAPRALDGHETGCRLGLHRDR